MIILHFPNNPRPNLPRSLQEAELLLDEKVDL
jgi:hypothetical protein